MNRQNAQIHSQSFAESQQSNLIDSVNEPPTKGILSQQNINFSPKCSLKLSTVVFVIMSLLFFVCGIPELVAFNQLKDKIVDYTECKDKKLCVVEFNLENDLEFPWIYYKIEGFFANYREYVVSRDLKQLLGKARTEEELKDHCESAYLMSQLGVENKSFSGDDIAGTEIAIPCGSVASSYFKDSFKLYKISDTNKDLPQSEPSLTSIFLNETEISNYYDRKYNYKNGISAQKTQWVDIEHDGKSFT